MSIHSHKDKATSDIANERRTKISLKTLSADLHSVALGKLVFLDNATALQDFVNWKNLGFEKLKGNRKDNYSIRLNDQFRICFRWSGKDALDVEIIVSIKNI